MLFSFVLRVQAVSPPRKTGQTDEPNPWTELLAGGEPLPSSTEVAASAVQGEEGQQPPASGAQSAEGVAGLAGGKPLPEPEASPFMEAIQQAARQEVRLQLCVEGPRSLLAELRL